MEHARALALDAGPAEDFGRYLLASGAITALQLMAARSEMSVGGLTLDHVLTAHGMMSADEVVAALSRFHGLRAIDLAAAPPDPELAALLPLQSALNLAVVPWRREAGRILIAASCPEDYARAVALIEVRETSFDLVLAPASDIRTALARFGREALTKNASARVPATESCRTWGQKNAMRLVLTLGALATFAALTITWPTYVFAALALWATFTLLVASGLRLAAYFAQVSNPDPGDGAIPEPPNPLPRVSVLVPLFKESEIAETLLARLSRLTYPKSCLDVVLVLEENDALTRSTIEACDLPAWMRVVEVPEGAPKTKPRAMNYALDFCDGEIIGIWDAEDKPHPQQIETVAAYFAKSPDNIVCLQGVLDYYNSRQNWLARCFTIEYAAWFRLVLPGMAHLGLAIPLGGTTLFFRRDKLEELGGWDAHNVTEDADLGFRLARHGYRTDIIPTVTGEEANCRLWPWIRQRSRWLKGYMVTYLVHMRRPAQLYRQLGHRRFWGFQAHFVSALSQFVLAPFLWSFWLVLFNLPHPLDPFVSREIMIGLGLTFLMVEVISVLINATAVSGRAHRHLLMWVPTMHFYYPLGAIAAYKALYELVAQPFYWDKTQHGHSLVRPTRRSWFRRLRRA